MDNIGIVIAMEEELEALKIFCKNNSIFLESVDNTYNLSTYKFSYNKFQVFVIVSKIGKAASAVATTLLVHNFKCNLIINIGSCGGVNEAIVGDVIISNCAAYSDVDVTAFGYKLGQLPMQPEIFVSSSKYYNFNDLRNYILKDYSNIKTGTVITNDSFISSKEAVQRIKDIYNNTKAIDMEAASVAQTCNLFEVPFLLVKKVSDSADDSASKSFSTEINKMQQTLPLVIAIIFSFLQKDTTNIG